RAVRGRADRKPRLGHRRADHGSAVWTQRGRGHDADPRDARPLDRGALRPPRPARRGPDGGRPGMNERRRATAVEGAIPLAVALRLSLRNLARDLKSGELTVMLLALLL